MASGRVTARSLCIHCIKRIHSIDQAGPRLRSVLEINPDALASADKLDAERAAGSTRGPLHGVPILVKDNIDTGDLMRSTAGSLALMESQPGGEAHVVSLLRAQGAIVLGKTQLSEWANFRGHGSHSGWCGVGGQCRNPHVLDRSPQGSSSGSAVAVAAGLCAAALGTETDGSIVAPASAVGIVGIKPTVGLTSRTGVCPIAASQDSVGTFGRTVADAVALLEAIAGPDERDPASKERAESVPCAALTSQLQGVAGLQGKRIGLTRDPWYELDARAAAVCDEAVRTLEAAGAVVVEVTLGTAVESRKARVARVADATEEKAAASEEEAPWLRPATEAAAEQPWFKELDDELFILTYELRRDLTEYLATRRAYAEDAVQWEDGGLKGTRHGHGRVMRSLEAVVRFNQRHADEELRLFGQEHFEKAMRMVGSEVDAHYEATLASNRRCSRAEGLDAAMDAHQLDALLAPAGPPAGETQPHPGGEGRLFYFGSSSATAVAGYPIVSVPAGTWQVGDVRLPVNINLMGRRWDEARLLQIAHGFEQASCARVEPRYDATMDVEAAVREGRLRPTDGSSKV